MGKYSLSPRAEQDIAKIRRESIQQFGLRRTLRYLEDLETEYSRLASGYPHGVVPVGMEGLLRYRVESHYVFFLRNAEGIFISRVLHTRRQASLHIFPARQTP